MTSHIVGMIAKGLHDMPSSSAVADVAPEIGQDNVLPMARAVMPAGLALAQVRDLLERSGVDELKRVSDYIGKMIELREMESGVFTQARQANGRPRARAN